MCTHVLETYNKEDGKMTKKVRTLTIDEAKRIATEQGLTPGRMKRSKSIEFTRFDTPGVKTIGWSEFERVVLIEKLSILESSGYLKLVKASIVT
jgi:type II secretory pathway component PulF